MQLSHSIRAGAWVVLFLNLFMAFGAIGVFLRMSPAIQRIIDQNVQSLEACEIMLACLAKHDEAQGNTQKAPFESALQRAKENVTETNESEPLRVIENHMSQIFEGDSQAKQQTVDAVIALAEANRQAMEEADLKAQKLGSAGAWGVVFMGFCSFFSGLLFWRTIQRQLVSPLEEIYQVVVNSRGKDRFRRCSGASLAPDIQTLYDGVNEMLDDSMADPEEEL